MKTLLFIIVVFKSSFAAAPVPEEGKAEILLYDNTNDGNGNYEFSFETSNGLQRSETGKLVNKGQPDQHLEVQGYYSYTDPDGKYVIFTYMAGENGYHIKPFTINIPALEVASGPLSPAVVATLLG